MDEIFNQLKIFFEENPSYFYLLISAVFLVLGVGNFMNKDWAVDPANSSQRFNYDIFGHNAFRFVKGFFYIIGFIFGVIGFITNL